MKINSRRYWWGLSLTNVIMISYTVVSHSVILTKYISATLWAHDPWIITFLIFCELFFNFTYKCTALIFFSVLFKWSNCEHQNLQHFPTHSSCKSYADANRVSAIILGGGTGAQLFPLTTMRATPAVRQKIEHPKLITLFIYYTYRELLILHSGFILIFEIYHSIIIKIIYMRK
jgi:hypothetical protein